MSENEFYQWKLFYPFLSTDDNDQRPTFSLKTKLEMLSISDSKHCHQSRIIDRYIPLGNSEIALNIHSNNQIEFHLRNRHREIAAPIEHWSRLELKSTNSRIVDLPEKIVSRFDQNLLERIQRYLQELTMDENVSFETIELQKHSTIWHIDDNSDREIEQTDVIVIIPNHQENQYWRTISIRTSDHQQLLKTLTTFQLEEDKDFLDYLTSLLSSQIHQLNSLTTSEFSSGKAFVNLFSMSDAAFIELIRTIHFHH